MEIARYTKLPDLWSGLGRAVNNLTAVCITGISLKLLSADNHSAIIIAVPILFVAVSIAALLYSVRRNSFFDEIETANNQVYDEYWEQMESDGNDGVVPVKYWHSNWDEYTLFAFALKTMRPSSADIQTVDSIDIKNLKTDYQPGESPVTSATLSAEDAKKSKLFMNVGETETLIGIRTKPNMPPKTSVSPNSKKADGTHITYTS